MHNYEEIRILFIMKKILFIVNVDWFFISHRLPLAISAIEKGYEVHILSEGTGQREFLEGNGIIVHDAKWSRLKQGSNVFKEILDIFIHIKNIKPDLLHLVTIKPVLLGGLVSRVLRTSAVVSAISGLGFIYSSSGYYATVRRWMVSLLYHIALGHKNQKVIFQNKDDRKRLLKTSAKLAEKSVLIPGSGVDLSLFFPKPQISGDPIFMFVGRLLESKGVREFVRSAEILSGSSISARFVLVGNIDSSNPESITQNDLSQWKSEGCVEIWGHKPDMFNVMPLASVVVLPSYYGEGLPKALIEAAACGRAVITTDHPGCRDAIQPEITGLLIPVKDSQALADAMRYLILEPEECLKMGKAGRELADMKFDINKVIDYHMSIYSNLLEAP